MRFLVLACIVALGRAVLIAREDDISCIGHLPRFWKDWMVNQTNLFTSGSVDRQENGMAGDGTDRYQLSRMSLEQFCAHQIGVSCVSEGLDAGSRRLDYSLLLGLQAKAENDRDRSLAYDPSIANGLEYLDDERFRHVQMASELCASKCYCAPRDDKTGDIPAREIWSSHSPEVADVLVWNFDTQRASSRTRQHSEVSWVKTGKLNSTVASSLTTEQHSLTQYYVGANENKLVCDHGPVPTGLASLIYSYTSINYTNAQDICAHRYYGGNNATNMGGICIHDSHLQAHINFPYQLKSPQFTNDLRSTQVSPRTTFPKSMTIFCRKHCHCNGPVEEVRPQHSSDTGVDSPEVPTSSTGMVEKCPGTHDGDGACLAGHSTDTYTHKTPNTSLADQCPLHCIIKDEFSKPVCGDDAKYCQCRAYQALDPVFPQPTRDKKNKPLLYLTLCAVALAGVAANAYFARPLDLEIAELDLQLAEIELHLDEGIIPASLAGRDLGNQGGKGQAAGQRILIESLPCPCNASYVSFGCCSTDSRGLVWENVELNLGRLDHPGFD